MPIIAPIGKATELDATGAGEAELVLAVVAVGAAVAPVYVVVLTGARVSGRKDCPGLNSSVVFWEYANCAAKVKVEFFETESVTIFQFD
jgi:hypothetical protein